MTINEKALKLHEEWKGKLSTEPKAPVKTREDLALAYTPGVAEPCKEIAKNPEKAYELMASGFEEVTAEDIAADCEGLAIYGKAENEELISSGSIKAISQNMADIKKKKGECDTNDLTAFFSLVK